MSLKMKYGGGSKYNVPGLDVSAVSIDDETVGASTYSQLTISAARSGYTPIGIVGYNVGNATTDGVGGSFISVYQLYLDGTDVKVSVRNNRASDAKIQIFVDVLYA